MDIVFIFGAKYLFVLSIILFGVCAFRHTRETQKRIFLLLAVSGALSFSLSRVAGYLYYDPRPFVIGHFVPLIPHAPDNGFPSDHALLVFLLAAVLSTFDKKLSAYLWNIAILVSASRIYLGIHHAIDIVGSFFIVVGVTAVGHVLVQRLFPKAPGEDAMTNVADA